jgi:hypothetical protein
MLVTIASHLSFDPENLTMPKFPFLVTDSDSYKLLTLDYPTDNIFLMSPGVYTLREHELLLMGGSNDKGLIQLARGFKELSKFLGKAAGTIVECGTKDELSAVEFSRPFRSTTTN